MTAATDWSFIWIVTGIGFLFVVTMLVYLVGVMKLFGYAFTLKRKQPAAQRPKQRMSVKEEEIVAIATALQLYTSKLHERRLEIITIHKMKSIYSPWNSKIHGLTQIPERKTW